MLSSKKLAVLLPAAGSAELPARSFRGKRQGERGSKKNLPLQSAKSRGQKKEPLLPQSCCEDSVRSTGPPGGKNVKIITKNPRSRRQLGGTAGLTPGWGGRPAGSGTAGRPRLCFFLTPS